MNYATTLDLRNIADDWLAEAEDASDAGEAFAGEKYIELCEQLGATADPVGLESWANDYEPTMILESDFEDYARELAADICPWPSNSSEAQALDTWPYRCIDWKQAADELRHDYTSVTFDGASYYIRIC